MAYTAQRNYNRARRINYSKPKMFAWAVLISFQLALCIFVWLGCIVVFSNPENPTCYKILQFFKKAQKLKKFTTLQVPKGEFRSAENAHRYFYSFDTKDFNTINNFLKRAYLRNFTKKTIKPSYLYGKFKVIQIKNLNQNDVFQEGLVIRMQSIKYRETIVEYIIPTQKKVDASSIEIGDIIQLVGRRDYPLIIHAEKGENLQIVFTAVSIIYRNFESRGNTIKTTNPNYLNLDGKWPITENKIGRITQ